MHQHLTRRDIIIMVAVSFKIIYLCGGVSLEFIDRINLYFLAAKAE